MVTVLQSPDCGVGRAKHQKMCGPIVIIQCCSGVPARIPICTSFTLYIALAIGLQKVGVNRRFMKDFAYSRFEDN